MTPSLVSIIIPAYNRAHLLGTAIRSAQAQTYPLKQIIVVDDGSTDNTRELVATFADVEYYYQPNGGQAAARNAGLARCQGEFMASLDSDDVWEPDFLATCLAMIQEHELDFAFANWNSTNGWNGLVRFFTFSEYRQHYCTHPTADWWLLNAAQTRDLFVETCPAPSSALVVRRAALAGGWNEEMRIADDWCLVLDMVLNRPCRSAFTLTPHWLKHIHDGNIYDGRDQLVVIQELGFHDERLLAHRYRNQLNVREKTVFRNRLAQHYFSFAYFSWKRAAPTRTVAQHLAMAFWLAPLHIGRNSVGGALNFAQRQWTLLSQRSR
jgi:glycosyltransferase involved in cell wall biosynthesis